MIKVDVQTSTLLHRVGIVVQHHATATIHRQVDKMAAVKTGVDFTGSRPRPETITRLHSRTGRVQGRIDRVHSQIGRIQGHNRPVIAVDGSASLPTPVDARMIALLDAETKVAASRSWNSTNLSSRRATRLLMPGMAEALTEATAAVRVAATMEVDTTAEVAAAARAGGIAVAGMIAVRLFAAEVEVSEALAAAEEVLAAATAEIAVAAEIAAEEVEIAAEEVEIVVEAVAVRKAEGDGPAPGLARVVQTRCS